MRRVHRDRFWRMGAVLFVSVAPVIGFSSAAHADTTSGSAPAPSSGGVVGSTVSANAIGAQFAFNIPGLLPLPNVNILELDAPFARTNINPTVDSIAAPFYPGDVIGNLGGLESEFFPPQLPNTPYPFDAHAQYPPTCTTTCSPGQTPPSASFGGNAPAGLPLVPTVLAGKADASQSGGDATGTIADLVLGAGMGANGAALVQAAEVESSDAVTVGANAVTATASSVLKAVDIAGMVDISALTSDATSSSDGNTGSPAASVNLGSVTVGGQQATIDANGVHVVGNGAPSSVPTIAQLQKSLDATLAQDGITIRLLDPVQTVNGAEGIADAGGLVISIAHAFSVPFVNLGALTGGALQPCIPIPQLGSECLPAGNYTATTSITLGGAKVDVNAESLAQLLPSTTLPTTPDLGLGGTGDLGLGNLGSGLTSVGTVSGPGAATAPSSGQSLPSRLAQFPIRGVPAPLGWVVLGILLCVVFAYPMLLAARWQFLVGRR